MEIQNTDVSVSKNIYNIRNAPKQRVAYPLHSQSCVIVWLFRHCV